MIRRAFKYNFFVGLILLAAVIALLTAAGYAGSFFFDTVIAKTPFAHLRSPWVRWMFIVTGVSLGLRFLAVFIPRSGE